MYGKNTLAPSGGGSGFADQFINALTAPRVIRQGPQNTEYGDSFANALARSESGGSYSARNSLGYTGKYQFGQDRLDDFNRATGANYTTDDLLASPDLQERVFSWHVRDIDRAIDGGDLLSSGYSRNALRSVAHLGGIGGMRKFVRTGGEYNPSDAFGTSLSDYAQRHR